MAVENINAGGVYITVGLNTEDIKAQADAAAATVVEAFSSINIGGIASRLADDFVAAGQAAAAGGEAAAKSYDDATAAAERFNSAVTGGVARDPGINIAETTGRIYREQEQQRVQLQANRLADIERAAQAEIDAAARVGEARIRFSAQATGTQQLTGMLQAGLPAEEAAAAVLQRIEEERITREIAGEAQIEHARLQNVAAIDKEIASVEQLIKQYDQLIEEQRTGGNVRTGSLFGGLATTAFGAQMAMNGNAIMGSVIAMDGLSKSLSSIEGVSLAAATGIGAVGAAVIGIGSVAEQATAKVVGFIGNMLDAAKGLEVTAISFETLTGSAAAAGEEFQKLSTLAIKSPFDLKDLADVDKFLLTVDIGSTKMRQDLVAGISDMGAAFGFGADRLKLIAFAMAQVQAAGHLTGDEARQLRNQMIPYVEVLKTLPQFADAGSAEIKKMMEEGKISSEEFFQAYIAWSQKFQGAAQRQAETVQFLVANIKEAVQTRAGAAFGPETFGGLDVLAPVRDLLIEVRDLVQNMNWAPLASAVKNLFTSIIGGAQSAIGGLNPVKRFFEDILPRAIDAAAVVGSTLVTILRAIGQALASFTFGDAFSKANDDATTLNQTLVSISDSLKVITSNIIISGAIWAETFGGLVDFLKTIFDGITGLFKGLAFIVVKALETITSPLTHLPGVVKSTFGLTGIDDVHRELATASTALSKSTTDSFDAMMNAFMGGGQHAKEKGQDAWHAIQDMWKTETAKMSAIQQQGPGATGQTWFEKFAAERGNVENDIQNVLSDQASRDEQQAKNFQSAIDQMKERRQGIFNQLLDLTTSWFGQRSDLMKGLLGDKGFTATVDQIASMSKQVSEMLQQLDRRDLVSKLSEQTQALMALAGWRDVIADKLKDAEQKLKDAIAARDQLVTQVHDSSVAFVNALKQEQEKTTEVLRTDTGGFIVVERTRTKGFVQGLQERLTALKTFISQVRALGARGLDKGLLQQLIQAGPDQAGTVVDELSKSGDDVIGTVNGIQSDLQTTATAFGTEVGADFKQAGIDIIQATVDGLTSQQNKIQTAAALIALSMGQSLQGLARLGHDAGQQFGDEFAKGIQSGVTAAAKSLTAFQVSYLAKKSQAGFLEKIRDDLVTQINAFNANPTQGGTSPVPGLTAKLDAVEELLRKLWIGFYSENIANFGGTPIPGSTQSYATPKIQVFIGNEEIHSIARTQVQMENDAQMMGVSAGTRH